MSSGLLGNQSESSQVFAVTVQHSCVKKTRLKFVGPKKGQFFLKKTTMVGSGNWDAGAEFGGLPDWKTMHVVLPPGTLLF